MLFNLSKKNIIIIVAGMIAVFSAAWLVWKSCTSLSVPIEDIPLIRTMIVSADNVNRNYVYSGEVRGRYESQLAFQTSGKILKRYVERGSPVRPGQVLMEIDPQDIRQLVAIQQAQVAAAKSALQLAEQNLKRYKKLFEQEVISKAQLERFENARDSAQAGVEQAQAALTQAKNQMEYSFLRADKPGVISMIMVEAGQVVGQGQSVAVLVQNGDREIEISVPENRINDLRKSSRIKITFWAMSDIVAEGNIREIAPMTDPISHTYRVRILMPKPPSEVKLGMTASVHLAASDDISPTPYIPIYALYQTGDKPQVWIVQDDCVHLRAVKTGEFGSKDIQVISGLNPGDEIATAGVHKLREGQRIKAIRGEMQ